MNEPPKVEAPGMNEDHRAQGDSGIDHNAEVASQQPSFPGGRLTMLSTACGVGLALALIDLGPRVTNLAPDFGWLRSIALPGVLSAGVISLVFLTLLVGLNLVLRQRGRFSLDLACGLAAGLLLIQILLLLIDLKVDQPGLETLKRATVMTVIGAVFAISAWALLRRMEPDHPVRRSLIVLLQLAPLLSLAGVLLLHANRFHLQPTASLRFVAANGAVLSGLGVLFLCHYRRRREQSRLGLGMLVVLIGVTASAGLTEQRRWQSVSPTETAADVAIDRPSVLMLTVETLRADHLSCYQGSVSTPAMDTLARDGVLFERALAPAPWTVPSLASILTGLEPLVHGTTTAKSALDPQLTTIAERLGNVGYRTAALTDNPFVRLARLGRGFTHFNPYPKNWGGPVHRRFLRPIFQLPGVPAWCRQEVTARELTDEAIDWIQRHGNERFFLWLHYFDPHQPYTPPPEFSSLPPHAHPRIDLQRIRMGYDRVDPELRSRLQTLYRDEIRFTDHSIGRLLRALRDLGHYEDTLIVFTSDHGEEFWEHGGLEHGHTLYDELLRVPLVVKPARPGASGLRLSAPVSIVQIVPTLLELLSLEGSDQYLPSLAGHWRDDLPPPAVRPLYASSLSVGEPRTAVTSGGYKLIRWDHSDIEELYNIATDPRERHNLSFVEPEVLAHHRELLESFTQAASRLGHQLRGEAETHRYFDPDKSQQLKALGYVE
ncbi:MAG: sulfatase [Thermoanaerobaculales bacterium]|jgi:arylsulfatase A-like enzyme|nr:sulfatase [Thermoanaerobaculales bacterium]